MSKHIPAFEKFIQDLRAAWKELPDTEARMKKGQKLLEELVKDESMRQASKSWPSTEGRKNLLFHEDEECGFAINGVVRNPGRLSRRLFEPETGPPVQLKPDSPVRVALSFGRGAGARRHAQTSRIRAYPP